MLNLGSNLKNISLFFSFLEVARTDTILRKATVLKYISVCGLSYTSILVQYSKLGRQKLWPKVVKHLAKSCKAFGHVCVALIKLGKAQVFGVDTIIFLQL